VWCAASGAPAEPACDADDDVGWGIECLSVGGRGDPLAYRARRLPLHRAATNSAGGTQIRLTEQSTNFRRRYGFCLGADIYFVSLFRV
jgi:hypothetical protein